MFGEAWGRSWWHSLLPSVTTLPINSLKGKEPYLAGDYQRTRPIRHDAYRINRILTGRGVTGKVPITCV